MADLQAVKFACTWCILEGTVWLVLLAAVALHPNTPVYQLASPSCQCPLPTTVGNLPVAHKQCNIGLQGFDRSFRADVEDEWAWGSPFGPHPLAGEEQWQICGAC